MCHQRCVLKTATLVLYGHHRCTSEHSTAHSTSVSLCEHLVAHAGGCGLVLLYAAYHCVCVSGSHMYYIVKDRRGRTGECVCMRVCMYTPICNTSWDILTSSKEEIGVRLGYESRSSGRAFQTGEQQPTDQSATEVC